MGHQVPDAFRMEQEIPQTPSACPELLLLELDEALAPVAVLHLDLLLRVASEAPVLPVGPSAGCAVPVWASPVLRSWVRHLLESWPWIPCHQEVKN